MPHLDPDILALIALGETVETDADTSHLASCSACRDEVAALSATVVVGRRSLSDDQLVSPDARVWEAISDELGLKPRRRSRRLVPALVAAAAAVVLIAGGAATWWALRPVPNTVLASAALASFPNWPTADGEAVLEQHPDGSKTVTVTVQAPTEDGAFREAWLIRSDATDLVSLGVVRGSSATFDVPAGVDITQFDLVDVSQEADDGNPAHSGDSIVRGQLQAAAQ
ncbi:hypothetical protein GCM10027413_02760 [Conyzicola nivalis]|uniref:Anti-sigma K factor RskA C-terminal domain-containing protein n=1 Tax=Conyzicola nivalis TaxID=1477021 RepID=A0A916SN14_9MICO|nr:anti-sigma factor [Conyzicola nivalis]GGB08555.1 hypothetical protein GCM10010979_23880 [Conyzicola nivalis]